MFSTMVQINFTNLTFGGSYLSKILKAKCPEVASSISWEFFLKLNYTSICMQNHSLNKPLEDMHTTLVVNRWHKM